VKSLPSWEAFKVRDATEEGLLMSDPQTLFNQILDHYKKSIEDYDEALSLYNEGKAPRPKTWYGRKNAERSTTILESGIFRKGGLKGKKLSVSGPPDYLVYPILDLKDLIEFLTGYFSKSEFQAKREKELQWVIKTAGPPMTMPGWFIGNGCLNLPEPPPSHQSQEAGTEQEDGGGEGDLSLSGLTRVSTIELV
jgi:hypothetical protein